MKRSSVSPRVTETITTTAETTVDTIHNSHKEVEKSSSVNLLQWGRSYVGMNTKQSVASKASTTKPVPKQGGIASKSTAPSKSMVPSAAKKTSTKTSSTIPRKPSIPKQGKRSSSKTDGATGTAITVPLSPFIADIDLKDEMIHVRNPSSTASDVSGWYVSDDGKRNKWRLPANTIISPKGSIHIYCCGKGEHMKHLKEPNLFWTNKDGTRRMRNVLNDDGDKVLLLRPDGTFIASCEKVPGGEPVIVKSN